jgi:hypothetical protein
VLEKVFTDPSIPGFTIEARECDDGTWHLEERAGCSFETHAKAALAASTRLGGKTVWWDHNGTVIDTTMGRTPRKLRRVWNGYRS